MQPSTKVLLGLGVAAVLGLGFFALSGKPATGSAPGGGSSGGGNAATLPTNIPLVVGQHYKLVLPDMPAQGQSWVMTTSAPGVAAVTDVGYAGGAPTSGPGLHAFTLTGVSAGTATITATLMSLSNGQPVSGVAPLSASVSVVAGIGTGTPPGGGVKFNPGGGVKFTNPNGGSGGGIKSSGGAPQQQPNQQSGGVSSVSGGIKTNGGGGNIAQAPPPPPAKTVTLTWPNSLNQALSNGPQLASSPIYLNVGDTLVVDITADTTSLPTCNQWAGCGLWNAAAMPSVLAWIPTGTANTPADAFTYAGVVAFSAMQSGSGTLALVKTFQNGAAVTWSIPVNVS